MTIKEYWKEYHDELNKYPVHHIASVLAIYPDMPTYFAATFTRFIDQYFYTAVDQYLMQLFGNYDIYVDNVSDIITAALKEREPYIRKQFEYMDAVYNPIENYAGHEVEENWINSDEKVITTDYDKKQHKDDYFYDTSQSNYYPGEKKTTYNNGTRQETTLQGKEDTVNKVVPYNGSALQNASGSSRSGNAANDSIQTQTTTSYIGGDPYTIEENLSLDGEKTTSEAKTDYIQYGAHKDQDKRTQDAYDDHTKRVLDKSGNIGVQTAAQMMEMDRSFWEANKWLRYLAKDIAGLLGAEVMGL